MDNNIVKEQHGSQIDVFFLWKVLKANIIKILIAAVLMAAALGAFRYTSAVPYYSTDVKFLINGVYRDPTDSQIHATVNNPGLGANIAYNAPQLITTDRALDAALKYLQDEERYGDRYAYLVSRNLQGMISVSVDNQIVTVRISSSSENRTRDVAKAIQETVPGIMDYYFGVENVDNAENLESVAKAITAVSDDSGVFYTGRHTVGFATLGFVLGMILMYVIAFLGASFDNTVYTEEDLKSHFTLPVIGQIPTWDNTSEVNKAFKDKSRKKRYRSNAGDGGVDRGNLLSDRDYQGRLLCKQTPFAVTEAFKTLRTNLCYTGKGQKCAVYGVTSAYVSAGKSLVMANIAISFAQLGKRVLLVDCDLRCPVQHKIFALDNKVDGMSELLSGQCEYEDLYLRSAGYDHLSIITSGRIPPNPAELLASDRMKDFLQTARENFDVVFIDLPPVSEVSDAGIISELVTGFVMVVRAGYSDRRMIQLAGETMQGFNASFVGFILNDVDIKSGDYYKNKYYGGYGKFHMKYGKYSYYRRSRYGYYSNYKKYRYQTSEYETSAGENASAEEEETPTGTASDEEETLAEEYILAEEEKLSEQMRTLEETPADSEETWADETSEENDYADEEEPSDEDRYAAEEELSDEDRYADEDRDRRSYEDDSETTDERDEDDRNRSGYDR